jgi:hypothetical protein
MTNIPIVHTELEYHLQRARVESDLARDCADGPALDSHMQLAELHLERASLLQAVQERQVGNVTPLRPNQERRFSPIAETAQLEACADQS